MTRKERDKMMLRIAMEFVSGEGDDFTNDEILDGLRFALVGGDAPPWWAEVAYDLRAANREHREEGGRQLRLRCDACSGKGWLVATEVQA